MNTEQNKSDAALEAAMKSWQVPDPSPWLRTRATQNIVAQVNASRISPWPLAPLRLGSAFAAFLMFGLLLGAGLPGADLQTLDAQTPQTQVETDIADASLDSDVSTDLSAAETADDADLIALLW